MLIMIYYLLSIIQARIGHKFTQMIDHDFYEEPKGG